MMGEELWRRRRASGLPGKHDVREMKEVVLWSLLFRLDSFKEIRSILLGTELPFPVEPRPVAHRVRRNAEEARGALVAAALAKELKRLLLDVGKVRRPLMRDFFR